MDEFVVVTKENLNDLVSNFNLDGKLIDAIRIERKFIINLVNYRKRKGITQKELSKLTGLTQQSISRIETLIEKPTLTTLIKYLNALDIDINSLLKK
ncbi:helix-turn-helix domain-containing protein [Clostridioides sp. GD02377]|uniref:helix-turn-helix domain-containing protein n=1 Tax=unclassified Clostridioides TaxID=2635829 RepID=UPI0038A87D01